MWPASRCGLPVGVACEWGGLSVGVYCQVWCFYLLTHCFTSLLSTSCDIELTTTILISENFVKYFFLNVCGLNHSGSLTATLFYTCGLSNKLIGLVLFYYFVVLLCLFIFCHF